MNHLHQTEQTKTDVGRTYWFFMLALATAILLTASLTIIQTQKRHQAYNRLIELQKAQRQMQVEEQRLLIEQQTFSATPKVAQRAVNELGMFYPDERHRMVVAPPKTKAPK